MECKKENTKAKITFNGDTFYIIDTNAEIQSGSPFMLYVKYNMLHL